MATGGRDGDEDRSCMLFCGDPLLLAQEPKRSRDALYLRNLHLIRRAARPQVETHANATWPELAWAPGVPAARSATHTRGLSLALAAVCCVHPGGGGLAWRNAGCPCAWRRCPAPARGRSRTTRRLPPRRRCAWRGFGGRRPACTHVVSPPRHCARRSLARAPRHSHATCPPPCGPPSPPSLGPSPGRCARLSARPPERRQRGRDCGQRRGCGRGLCARPPAVRRPFPGAAGGGRGDAGGGAGQREAHGARVLRELVCRGWGGWGAGC
jgi:hypothetical protein